MENRPLELLIKEYKNNLFELTNNCKLHPAVIRLIVDDFHKEIVNFTDKSEETAINEYYRNVEKQSSQITDIDSELVSIEQ